MVNIAVGKCKQITTATPVTLKPPTTRSCGPPYPNSDRESLATSQLFQPLAPTTIAIQSQPTRSVHTEEMLNQHEYTTAPVILAKKLQNDSANLKPLPGLP